MLQSRARFHRVSTTVLQMTPSTRSIEAIQGLNCRSNTVVAGSSRKRTRLRLRPRSANHGSGEPFANGSEKVSHDFTTGETVFHPASSNLAVERDEAGNEVESNKERLFGDRLLGSAAAKLEQSQSSGDGVGTTSEPLVIGSDDRVEVTSIFTYPERTNVKIFNTWSDQSTSVCSGTLVGSKYVLTAGHCVYDNWKGGWAQSNLIVPALSGYYMPFGSSWGVRGDGYNCWFWDQDDNCDLMLITLDRRVGNVSGTTPLCSLPDEDWDATSVAVRGYPGDIPAYPSGAAGLFQYDGEGSVTDVDPQEIFHNADTSGGNSGSGVWPLMYYPAFDCAVHSGWVEGWWNYDNRSTRITNARFYDIYDWMDANEGLGEIYGPYTNWVYLGGQTAMPPVVTTSHNGRYFDFFYTDKPTTSGGVPDTVARRIYHKSRTASAYNPSITGWTDIGPSSPSAGTLNSPAAVSRANGLLDVFMTNTNGNVWTKAWNGSAWVPSQTGWWDIGAPPSGSGGGIYSQPTVVAPGSNILDVFGVSKAGQIWHKRYNGSWGSWEYIGGYVPPYRQTWVAAVSRASGLIDIFWRDSSGAVLTKAWNGSTWLPSQTGYWNLGGVFKEAPTVVAPSSGTLDVFGRGMNDQVYWKRWTGNNWAANWTSLGGSTTAPIAAVSRASGLVDLFARTASGEIWQKAWNGSSWQPSLTDWWNFGGDFVSVATTSSASNRLEVFGRGTDGSIHYRWWDGSRWWL